MINMLFHHYFSGLMKKPLLFILLLVPALAHAGSPPMPTDWTWVETPMGRPVVDRGEKGAWDHYAVDNPYVHSENGKFYCFFEAQDKDFRIGGHERFGLAVSRDGIQWKKHLKPLLDVGRPEDWDSIVAKLPSGVVKQGGKYHLFYSGRDAKTKQIGLATAERLTGPWTKSDRNPVLPSRHDAWDRHISTYPAPVFQIEGRYYLLFRGMKGFYSEEGVGAAVSTDLIHWKRAVESQSEPLTATEEEVASFAVARVGGRYVGISQTLNPRESRRYWYSDDLLHWEKGPKTRFVSSGKVDTLSNPFVVNGQWNVVYEQGDRIYRAVLVPERRDRVARPRASGDGREK